MNISRLDQLPVELWRCILSHLSAHEIFHSFTYLSSYIDGMLKTYTKYRVNFKAISRNDFDLVCQHIRPDQVISLILSDDENTPGLISLFLSRFQIHQFTCLRTLWLIDIGPDFWTDIIPQMIKLKHLRSFFFDLSYPDNSSICNLSQTEVAQLDRALIYSYSPVLPQLYQLRLNYGHFPKTRMLSHHRDLIFGRLNIHEIKNICSITSQLRSLDVSLSIESLSTDLIPPMSQLSRLSLQIWGRHFHE